MHCSYWAQILFQRDWFFLISVCSRSIIVCQFPIMLWINKAAATIRRILYGWRILCCFFPCFLILASGQFLNIAGWILFYATIHVYSVFFLLIFKLGHSNVSNINSVSLRNTVRFVFICKIFVISDLEFLFIGFAGSRRFDSLDFDWLKLMKVLLL